jgi:hypothetical protein
MDWVSSRLVLGPGFSKVSGLYRCRRPTAAQAQIPKYHTNNSRASDISYSVSLPETALNLDNESLWPR